MDGFAARTPGNRPTSIRYAIRFVSPVFENADELVINAIPNAEAWNWMVTQIPFFHCPSKRLEEIYYFRWWTFRKHIKETSDGFVITEFLPKVGWSAKPNVTDVLRCRYEMQPAANSGVGIGVPAPGRPMLACTAPIAVAGTPLSVLSNEVASTGSVSGGRSCA